MIIPAHTGGNAPARMSSPPAIALHQVSHFFGSNQVLNHVNLSVPEGTILALLGPSGCGKSTLLKMLAGLLHPASGQISFDGEIVASGKLSVPPEKRNLGMAFQDYALWPHMSVRKNVAFPLQMRGIRGAAQHEKVMAALERVGLADFVSRRPSELSGGQQQRVALARAIVAEPRILLFDEPLSNLDRNLRESLCEEMATLLRQLGTTAVYVTHDQHEAHALAHRIARMEKGAIASIEQTDPSVVSPFVA
ncbi:ABC transporter ATP-binding protein [Rahnella bonaserana]|jgi:iron(III) transport system ATP-binding protein|uniref:ABC transporter ATP-binding protein n=1 Tax=Rahnella bonaserana TaxID=2816248 RepID=UPI0024C25ED8|nr:ABC transporter ATP-binding protein [Rahnella bonaserana]WHZ42775.1 ABC transporter ATP-binding protein [Rahnella bonaserana]